MFTGIIEEVGQVLEKTQTGKEGTFMFRINCSFSWDLALGESVCVDGVCTTVTKTGKNFFEMEASEKTCSITTFASLEKNAKVNLERSLKLSDRLSGHIVYGHVDRRAKVSCIEDKGEYYLFDFIWDEGATSIHPLIQKGSICVNGISLTVYEVNPEGFTVMIIGYTFEHTNMKFLKVGSKVNIEHDAFGKYIEVLGESYKNLKS